MAGFLAGLGSAVAVVTRETALQQNVPRDALSQVAAYDEFGSGIGVPLGQLAVVPLAALFGAPQVAVVGGVLFSAVYLAALAVPSVRRLRAVAA